nr:hypothetical protein [Nocardioides panacis]
MPSATWRTSTAWGFSLETSDSMNPNEPSARVSAGTSTRMPEAPTTTCMPALTSAIGSVNTRRSWPLPSAIRPQSISGFWTGTQ